MACSVAACLVPPPTAAAVAWPAPSRDVRLIPLDRGALPAGINDTSYDAAQATPAQIAQQNRDLGSGVVRFTLPWKYVEPVRGRYQWAHWDALVQALRAAGLRPLPIIMFAPGWAAPAKQLQCNNNSTMPSCSPFRAPPEVAYDLDWERFAGAVATRYPDSVGIEVWNEPNLGSFWGGSADPLRYVQLLQRAYVGIKATRPTMPVVGGALSNTQSDVAPNLSIGTYTQRMLDLGAADVMDAFSFHPYPWATDVTGTSSGFRRAFDAVRPRLRAKGLEGRLRLWLTETGSTTTGAPPAGLTESQQAQVSVDLYEASRAMGDVDIVVFHTMIDRCAIASDAECGYGFLRADGSGGFATKQAYRDLSAHLTALRAP